MQVERITPNLIAIFVHKAFEFLNTDYKKRQN